VEHVWEWRQWDPQEKAVDSGWIVLAGAVVLMLMLLPVSDDEDIVSGEEEASSEGEEVKLPTAPRAADERATVAEVMAIRLLLILPMVVVLILFQPKSCVCLLSSASFGNSDFCESRRFDGISQFKMECRSLPADVSNSIVQSNRVLTNRPPNSFNRFILVVALYTLALALLGFLHTTLAASSSW